MSTHQIATRLAAVLAPLVAAALATAVNGPTAAPAAEPAGQTLTLGDEFVVADGNRRETWADVAYNPKHGEYLVAWTNWSARGQYDVHATRVSATGRILGTFPVATGADSQFVPSVVCGTNSDAYLVVYGVIDAADESSVDVYGRLVRWYGPDPNLSEFNISGSSGVQEYAPEASYATRGDGYLVAWTAWEAPFEPPEVSWIGGRRLASFGPMGEYPRTLSGVHDTDAGAPDVAYNSMLGEYLVVWSASRTGTYRDIYGVRLSQVGGVLPGGGDMVSAPFPIAGWPDDEIDPAVAYSPAADQYLVVYQSRLQSDTSTAVKGRYLSGRTAPGAVQVIGSAPNSFVEPAVAASTGGERYLVAWSAELEADSAGIRARVVTPDEVQEPELELVAPQVEADRRSPAVAGGASGFLVVWDHTVRGGADADLHARLVDPPVLAHSAYLARADR